MRTTINGTGPFYEIPPYCGACKFAINANTKQSGGKSWCSLFEKRKNFYDSPPKRCAEMFEKALAIGGDVVLVSKDDET